MKVLTIVATLVGVSMAALPWTRCLNDGDCGTLQCCDVTNDGQTATRLCGTGTIVPAGSDGRYDGGAVRCRSTPVAALGAASLGASTVAAVCTTAAYLMA